MPQTRVGLVHAAVNTTALSLYLASLVAGARGRRRGGQALGLAGLGVLPGGGYLGGHLCFVLGVEVNRTAWEQQRVLVTGGPAGDRLRARAR